MKSYDTVWATQMIAQYLAPDAYVVSLQNSINEERIAGIVANWPTGASAVRAARLRLKAPANFAEIVRQYIDDCTAAPNAAQTLKGMLK